MEAILYDQTFANSAVSGHAVIDTVGGASPGDGETLSTSAQTVSLEIKFDAATGAYSLTGAGLGEIFAPADATPDDGSGFKTYRKDAPDSIDYLSLETIPGLRYVRLGYWQHNQRSASGQADITFTPFAYGLATPAAAVPRSGYGGYDVDMFGFFTPLGAAPKVLQGDGEFRADFASGLYLTNGKAYEYHLLVDYHVGQYDWRSSGRLTADGGFSGPFIYVGAYGNTATGELNGRFYGPNGEEIGAAATGATTTGGSLSAVLTGRSSSAVTPRDLSNATSAPFEVYTTQAPITHLAHPDGTASAVVGYGSDFGRFSRDAGGTYRLDLNSPAGGPTGTFAQANYVAAKSDGRATVYEKGAERLTLYNPRHADLNLTFTSFGLWQSSAAFSSTTDRFDRIYFAYGSLPTQDFALGRTGIAQYAAKLHGWGVNLFDARQFDVSGDMTLGINLSTMQFNGALHAVGADAANGQLRDFGSYTFSGAVNGGYNYQAYFDASATGTGGVTGRLFGPAGEETAASFEIITRDAGRWPADFVKGLAIGKRQ